MKERKAYEVNINVAGFLGDEFRKILILSDEQLRVLQCLKDIIEEEELFDDGVVIEFEEIDDIIEV